MCAFSSEWDDLDPDATWRKRIADPATAALQIAADKKLIAALLHRPIDLEGLHAALKADACPNRTVYNGFPALHVAIGARDGKALALLLRFGARMDDLDAEGFTALDFAHRQHFSEGIRQLKQLDAPTRRVGARDDAYFDADASADDVDGPSYRTRINAVLRRAIEKGTAAEVAQALELGADVNAVTPYGTDRFPPLQKAVAAVDADKVRLLLQAGADVFAKGPLGTEAADALWFAGRDTLFTPAWDDIFAQLHAQGYSNMFVKPRADFTPDDLRQPLPTGEKDAPSLLHHLVEKGQGAFVLEVLRKHPGQPLTAQELQMPSKYYSGHTLLQAFGGQKMLAEIFTAAVWQGRVEEMLSLKPLVEKDFFMKGKIDFDKAAADVRAARLDDLRQKAGTKLRLKPQKRIEPK